MYIHTLVLEYSFYQLSRNSTVPVINFLIRRNQGWLPSMHHRSHDQVGLYSGGLHPGGMPMGGSAYGMVCIQGSAQRGVCIQGGWVDPSELGKRAVHFLLECCLVKILFTPFIDKTTKNLSPRKMIFHFILVYYFQDAKQTTRRDNLQDSKKIAAFYCDVNLIKFHRHML